jgi:hypothetical protein
MIHAMDPRSRRAARLVALGLAAFALLIYVYTLYPTVGGGDSGELTAAACQFGVVHPPGYPIETLLGHLFTHIPYGTLAWRVNLLSAVADAGAAAVLALAVTDWAASVWAGLLAGGLFALSPLVWTYAITAEVFALNNLFAAGLLYLSVRWAQRREREVALAASAWFGLGMSNHHTLLFLGVPVLAFILWTGREELWNQHTLGRMAALFALGLAPYLYLPLASRHVPLIGWGDQTTVRGFVDHLLRRDFGTFTLVAKTTAHRGDGLRRIALYFRQLAPELLWVFPAVALGGAAATARRDPLARLWLGALAVYVLVFCALANVELEDQLSVTVQKRFFQMPNLVVCAFAGLGLAELARRLPSEIARVAVAALALAVPVASAALRFERLDQHENQTFVEYGHAVLDPLPEGAILVIKGDQQFSSIAYVQACEGFRTDVHVLSLGYLTRPWSLRWLAHNHPEVNLAPPSAFGAKAYDVVDRLGAPTGGRRLFLLFDLLGEDKHHHEPYGSLPWGMAREMFVGNRPLDIDPWLETNHKAMGMLDRRWLLRFGRDTWESEVMGAYRSAGLAFGAFALQLAQQTHEASGDMELLATAIDALVAVEPLFRSEPYAPLYKTLGAAYELLAATDPAAVPSMLRAYRRFLEMAGDDPQVPEIRATVERFSSRKP